MSAATTVMADALQAAQQQTAERQAASAHELERERIRWSEAKIGKSLALSVFHKHLVVLPNSYWPGFESDLMVVTPELYLIDVEIKISRADLKQDVGKKKWVAQWWHALQQERRHGGALTGFKHRRMKTWDETTAHKLELAKIAKWPAKVWKHYYALPKSIWKRELMDALPSEKSGVLLLTENLPRGGELGLGYTEAASYQNDLPVIVDIARQAQPNTEVEKLTHEDVVDIARLASLRMWDAFARTEAEMEGHLV